MFEPIDVRVATRSAFTGRLVRHELGPLQVLRLSADASGARRTRRLIEASDPESLGVMLQLRGSCAIVQDDRRSLVPANDIGCWHSSAPYVIKAEADFDILMVTCPAAILSHDADRFRRRTAQRIDGSAGVARLVRQHIITLSQILDGDECSQPMRSHLAEGLVDLIRALHAPSDLLEMPLNRSAQCLRARIDRYIEEHLADDRLSRITIARENFISRSYLDRLYAHSRHGVWATVRAKRLDRVRRDLADPTLCHDSIFSIGSRWGFTNPSHLSRAFRDAYGQSPTAYRRSMLSGASEEATRGVAP